VTWARRHLLVLTVAVLAVLSLVFFTWADWHTYVQDQEAHRQTAEFWSNDFLANWGDNAAQNWHSELLFGVLVVVLLKKLEGPRGADQDDA
jgi:hypothetical protein